MPKFSVIIPTYNRCELLKRAVASVEAQSFKDYEIIVVDDGSTDETQSFLESVGGRIRSVRQMNGGAGAARNSGSEVAHGDYLAFLDSDDEWFPWTLSVFDRVIIEYEYPAMVVGSVLEYSNGTRKQTIVSDEVLKADAYDDFLSACQTSYHFGAGMGAVRTEVFRVLGGFSEDIRVAEDHDFSMRAGTEQGFVKVNSPPTLLYQRHEGGITTDMDATLYGIHCLISKELAGSYPGGRERRKERIRMLGRNARPVAMSAIEQNRCRDALKLIKRIFWWQLMEYRLRFLMGSGIMIIVNYIGCIKWFQKKNFLLL